MNDTQSTSAAVYRRAAQQLRDLAAQSYLPDIRGDLLDLSARFERMAVYFEAQDRLSSSSSTENERRQKASPIERCVPATALE
jgi:hypothetical protein